MGLAADHSCIQYRMLNRGKGPAVHSLRAQADRRRYQEYMKHTLEKQENLELKQAQIVKVLTEGGAVSGLETNLGGQYGARALVVAMEKARDMGLRNVFFIDMDVAEIENIFAPGEIDRLFINFPDPWPRKKNAKRRLTHRGFLDKYCRVVREGGEFHFKTDNAPLFAFSLEEFAACGLETKNITDDLHKDGVLGIMTGYEEKFHALGTPIHRCEVVCKPFVLPKEEKKEPEEA